MTDLYDTLGVAKDATKEAIKSAFRRKAKTAHPDVGGSPETFHAIEIAHRILSDEDRRQEYDRTGNTDAEPDNEKAVALSIISGIVDRFLNDEQARFKDLIGELRKTIKSDIRTAKGSIDEGAKYKARTEQLRGRVKGKGAAVLLAMFDTKLRDVSGALESLAQQIKIRELALTLLDDTTFDVEQRPASKVNMGWDLGGLGSSNSTFR